MCNLSEVGTKVQLKCQASMSIWDLEVSGYLAYHHQQNLAMFFSCMNVKLSFRQTTIISWKVTDWIYSTTVPSFQVMRWLSNPAPIHTWPHAGATSEQLRDRLHVLDELRRNVSFTSSELSAGVEDQMNSNSRVVRVLIQRLPQHTHVLFKMFPQEAENITGPGVDHISNALQQKHHSITLLHIMLSSQYL